jgi:hypothetical protein
MQTRTEQSKINVLLNCGLCRMSQCAKALSNGCFRGIALRSISIIGNLVMDRDLLGQVLTNLCQ